MSKVVLLCTQMEAGGVQTRATQIKEYLTKQGHEVLLIFIYQKRPSFQTSDTVRVLVESEGKNNKIILGFMAIVKLWKLLRSFTPDAIIGFAHYSSPIAAILGMTTGVRIRIATQTNPPERAPFIARILDVLAGILPIYTINVVNSKYIESKFEGYPQSYRRKIRLVYNGIATTKPKISKFESRNIFRIPLDGKIIISVGRLSAQKNHRFIISALPRLSDFHYVLVGVGELKSELAATAESLGVSDRVHFMGEIERAKIPDVLASADVFAFPSKYEAFGLSVVEAMDAGLPVVASDIEVFREIIGEAGSLVSLNDVEGWVKTLELVAGTSAGERLGKKAAERAKDFSLDSMCESFESLIS